MEKGNYKYLTEKDLEDGRFIMEMLALLNDEEKKTYLIYTNAVRDVALLRKDKVTA